MEVGIYFENIAKSFTPFESIYTRINRVVQHCHYLHGGTQLSESEPSLVFDIKKLNETIPIIEQISKHIIDHETCPGCSQQNYEDISKQKRDRRCLDLRYHMETFENNFENIEFCKVDISLIISLYNQISRLRMLTTELIKINSLILNKTLALYSNCQRDIRWFSCRFKKIIQETFAKHELRFWAPAQINFKALCNYVKDCSAPYSLTDTNVINLIEDDIWETIHCRCREKSPCYYSRRRIYSLKNLKKQSFRFGSADWLRPL